MRPAKTKFASHKNSDRRTWPKDSPFLALIRTYGLVQRYMQLYFARFGISAAQWGILRVLDRHESTGKKSMRLTDIGDQLLIQPPSVTGVVDRLERQRLVNRAASSTDLRAKHVRLTQAGRQLVQRVLDGLDEQTSCALKCLSSTEQKELQRLLRQLGTGLEGLLAHGAAREALQ